MVINTAVLCVPATVASQTIRRQQLVDRPTCSYPSFDREARKRFVNRYVVELEKAGFEVFTCPDVVRDQILVKVRKGNIMYCKAVNSEYFTNDLCIDLILRELVRKVENAFSELKETK